MNIRKTVGRRITKKRKEQGLSREELAEFANLHPNIVGMIERGEVNTGFENLHEIGKVLKISLVELFEGY